VYITLKRAGVVAEIDACQAVAAYCLCDMARVSVETQKLIDLNKPTPITKRDVDDMVYKDADYRIYEMTNAISRRDYSTFCAILYDLLSKGYDENALLSSLLSYFKNLLFIASSDKSEKELAELLKMKEFGVKKSREQAQSIGKNKLIGYVNGIYARIADIKSGKLTPTGSFNLCLANIFFA
jgi:DNA polymerase III delta subunit